MDGAGIDTRVLGVPQNATGKLAFVDRCGEPLLWSPPTGKGGVDENSTQPPRGRADTPVMRTLPAFDALSWSVAS